MYLPLDELLNMSQLCLQAYVDTKLEKSEVQHQDDWSADKTAKENEVDSSVTPDDDTKENDA